MSKIQTYINYIADPRARRSIRELFTHFMNDDTGRTFKDIVFGAGTTPITISGACTTGISITGACTTGISITSTTATVSLAITKSSAVTTGNIRAGTIALTMTAAATANVVEALKVTITSNVKTGTWANAIVGSIDYSTSGAAHGMAASICAEMIPPNSSLARGALYALDIVFGCGASSSWGSAGPCAFIHLENWGTAAYFSANAFLLHLAGETSATGAMVYTNSLKIQLGTATKYLVYGDAQQGLHMGTAAAKNTLVASTPYLSNYVTSAATAGNLRTAQFDTTFTVASTANQIEALTSIVTANVKTGGWCNAIFGKIDYSTNGLAHGIAGVICAELDLPGSTIVRGEYCCFEAELGVPASCDGLANPTAFMTMNCWGTNVANFITSGYVFTFGGLGAAGASQIFQANTDQPTHALRILIDHVPYYMLLTSADNGSE